MVRLAAETNAGAVRYGRLDVREAKGEKLPFADGEFTCAAMMNVFFFLDADAVLGELHRMLGSRGRMVIHTVAPNPPPGVAPPLLARRMTFHTDEELSTLVTAHGFRNVVVRRCGRGELQLATARRT